MYTALLIRCALSMVTVVCVCTAVCTRLSLCVVHTCVEQQYSWVFACVGYAYVFEPAILPHLPLSVPAVQILYITCVCIISYVCMRLQLRLCVL